MKCLLVDDEPGIREGLAALLRRRGHDVRTAADVASARAALADDHDVLITDWRLPDGVAGDFLAAARCPAIAVSGHPEEIGPEHRLAAVLTKPVLPSRLLEAIAAVASPPPPTAAPLPAADEAAIAAFLATMPPAAAATLFDDGVAATVVVDLPPGAAPPAGLDPAIRPTLRDGRWQLVFRRRRSDAAAGWPGNPAEPADPVHGNAHAMPMRPPIDDRLPADLAELWSEP